MIFSKFTPVESKLKILTQKLMDEPLYMSDEFRDYSIIWESLMDTLVKPEAHEFYEIGDFGGLVGFANILPAFKADVVFKIWDKDMWGVGFVKEFKRLCKLIIDRYDLKRLASDSADVKMVRVGKMCGFKVEGRFKNAFMWNGDFYTLHKMRLLKEDK